MSTAVFSGADAVMLSAETATGRHPVRSVEMMDRIARQVEGYMWTEGGFLIDSGEPRRLLPLHEAVARSTAQLSRDLKVRAIVVLSTNPATAQVMCAARPAAPVVAATASTGALAQMSLLWGVIARPAEQVDLEDGHAVARRIVAELGLAESGEPILVITGFDPNRH